MSLPVGDHAGIVAIDERQLESLAKERSRRRSGLRPCPSLPEDGKPVAVRSQETGVQVHRKLLKTAF